MAHIIVLQFEYKEINYTLVLGRTQEVHPSIQVVVDGQELDGEAISKKIRTYRGRTFQDDVYIGFNVFRTHSGFDGKLTIGNKTVIVESLKNPSKFSIPNFSTEKQYKRLDVYPCIFYRPEDIIDSYSSSYESPNDVFLPGQFTRDSTDPKRSSRVKRDVTVRECNLHLMSDHRFYKWYCDGDILTTVSKMIYMTSLANTGLRNTDFDGDGSSDNIGLFVSKITVWADKTNPEYNFLWEPGTSVSASVFLDRVTSHNFTGVCIGMAFTMLDFGNIIGMTNLGRSEPHLKMGICSPYIRLRDGLRWLSSAFVSGVTNGYWLPDYRIAMTVSHEIGHIFGSPHDPIGNAECVPNDKEKGNYVMFQGRGSQPPKANGYEYSFSPCSISFMYPVIVNKGTCLTPTTELCGNGIKEALEECDCGSSSICDLIDPSCTPGDVGDSNPDPPCTVRRNGETPPPPTSQQQSTFSQPPSTTSQRTSSTSSSFSSTSPTQSSTQQSSKTSSVTSSTRRPCQCSIVYAPCCTNDCQFAPSWKSCRNAGECVKPTNCSGTSGECPQIIFEPDKKLCNNNRNTCLYGKCVASVCSIWNSTECECDPGAFECHECCLNATNQCIPAIINNTYIPKTIGSPCFQRQGFCDHRAICNLVDLVEDYLWFDEVFSPKAINEVGTWMQFYWYYVLAGVVGLGLLAAVFYTTFRQKIDVQSHAYMYGQFMKIKYEAEIQKKYIEACKTSTQSEYKRKMENPLQDSKRMGLNKALSRMKELFPTIADQELEKVLKICSKEEMAVYLILMKGFPLRRVDGLEMSE